MKKIFPVFIFLIIIFSIIIFSFRFPQRKEFFKLHPIRFDEEDFVELKTTSFLRDIKNRNIKAIPGYFLSTETDSSITEFHQLLNRNGEKTSPFDNIKLHKLEVEIKEDKAYVFFKKRDKQKQDNERKPDIIFLKKHKSWKIISFPNLFKKQELDNIDRKKVIKQ